jgi:transposase
MLNGSAFAHHTRIPKRAGSTRDTLPEARFLQAVALELRGRADIGDGDINAALRAALARFEHERLTWVAAVKAADRARRRGSRYPSDACYALDNFERGDKGYDSETVRQDIEQRGGQAMIPSIASRKIQHPVDKALYALRNRIERFFNRVKNSRRVAAAAPSSMMNSHRVAGTVLAEPALAENDCVAGHARFEPANPSAGYLIGMQ